MSPGDDFRPTREFEELRRQIDQSEARFEREGKAAKARIAELSSQITQLTQDRVNLKSEIDQERAKVVKFTHELSITRNAYDKANKRLESFEKNNATVQQRAKELERARQELGRCRTDLQAAQAAERECQALLQAREAELLLKSQELDKLEKRCDALRGNTELAMSQYASAKDRLTAVEKQHTVERDRLLEDLERTREARDRLQDDVNSFSAELEQRERILRDAQHVRDKALADVTRLSTELEMRIRETRDLEAQKRKLVIEAERLQESLNAAVRDRDALRDQLASAEATIISLNAARDELVAKHNAAIAKLRAEALRATEQRDALRDQFREMRDDREKLQTAFQELADRNAREFQAAEADHAKALRDANAERAAAEAAWAQERARLTQRVAALESEAQDARGQIKTERMKWTAELARTAAEHNDFVQLHQGYKDKTTKTIADQGAALAQATADLAAARASAQDERRAAQSELEAARAAWDAEREALQAQIDAVVAVVAAAVDDLPVERRPIPTAPLADHVQCIVDAANSIQTQLRDDLESLRTHHCAQLIQAQEFAQAMLVGAREESKKSGAEARKLATELAEVKQDAAKRRTAAAAALQAESTRAAAAEADRDALRDTLSAQIAELREADRVRAAKKAELETQLELADQRIISLEADLERAETRLRARDAEFAAALPPLREELDAAVRDRDALAARLEAETGALAVQLDEAREQFACDLSNLEQARDNEIAQLREERDQAATRFADADRARTELADRVTALETTANETAASLAETERQRAALQASLDQTNARLEDTERRRAELEARATELQAAVDQAAKEKAELVEVSMQLEAHCSASEARVAELQTLLDRATANAAAALAEAAANHEHALAEVTAAHTRTAAELRQELDGVRNAKGSEIAATQAELAQLRAQIQDMEAAHAAAVESVTAAHEARTRDLLDVVAKTESSIEAYKHDLSALNRKADEQLRSIESMQAVIDAANDDKAAAAEEVRAAREQADVVRQQLADTEAELARVRAALTESADASRAELEQQLASLRTERDTLAQTQADAELALNEARAAAATREQVLRDQARALEVDVVQARKEAAAAAESLETIQARFAELQNVASEAESLLVMQDKELGSLRERVTEVETELATARSAHEAALAEVTAERTAHQAAVAEHAQRAALLDEQLAQGRAQLGAMSEAHQAQANEWRRREEHLETVIAELQDELYDLDALADAHRDAQALADELKDGIKHYRTIVTEQLAKQDTADQRIRDLEWEVQCRQALLDVAHHPWVVEYQQYLNRLADFEHQIAYEFAVICSSLTQLTAQQITDERASSADERMFLRVLDNLLSTESNDRARVEWEFLRQCAPTYSSGEATTPEQLAWATATDRDEVPLRMHVAEVLFGQRDDMTSIHEQQLANVIGDLQHSLSPEQAEIITRANVEYLERAQALESECQELRNHLVQLQEHLANGGAGGNGGGMAAHHEEEIAHLQARLAEIDSGGLLPRHEELQREYEALKAREAQLTKELGELHDMISSVAGHHNDKQRIKYLEYLKQDRTHLRESAAAAQDELAAAKTRIQQLEAELDALRAVPGTGRRPLHPLPHLALSSTPAGQFAHRLPSASVPSIAGPSSRKPSSTASAAAMAAAAAASAGAIRRPKTPGTAATGVTFDLSSLPETPAATE
ncbi:hypothetical protein H9P43_000569 [Blastocladiella emersonii ATCC 22665]|nr:hypothetical protein H9P43_000569 [Blastocladiella emersonii ATCC 22665]